MVPIFALSQNYPDESALCYISSLEIGASQNYPDEISYNDSEKLGKVGGWLFF